MSIKKKLLSGALFLSGAVFINRILGILKNVVFAWVLTPGDIGLIGIAFIALQSLESFSKLGLNNALISKANNLDDYVNEAWVLSIFRGVLLSSILFLFSSEIAQVLGDNNASPFIFYIALTPLIKGFENPYLSELKYKLEFRKISFYNIVRGLSLNLSVIVLILFIKNIWAIVIALIISEILSLLSSFLLIKKYPKLNVKVSNLLDIFHYSKWVTITAIILFFATQFDNVYVSKVLGIENFGTYRMAKVFTIAIINDICSLVFSLTLPLYSRFQKTNETQKRIFKETLQLSLYVSSFLFVIIVFFGVELISKGLGQKWIGMTEVIIYFGMSGIVLSVLMTLGPMMLAIGKPKRDFQLNIVRSIILVISSLILIPLKSTQGASIALFISLVLVLPIWFRILQKEINLSLKELLIIIKEPTLIMIFTSFVAYLFSMIVINSIFQLLVILIGFIIVITLLYLLGAKKYNKGPFKLVFSAK